MGAIGVAIIAKKSEIEKEFSFDINNTKFETRGVECHRCSNNCEIMCVCKNDKIIDAWGNRCERGSITVKM